MASKRIEPVPIVLRVKRKREEEPADTLVVAKVLKLDPSLCEPADQVFQFHFAATVPHQHQTNKEVLAQISRHGNHPSKVKLSSFAGLSISRQQEDRRDAKKALVSDRRFRLTSQFRSLEEGKNQDSATLPEAAGGACDRNVSSECVHVYDLEQESPVKASSSCEANSSGLTSTSSPWTQQDTAERGGASHRSDVCGDMSCDVVDSNSSTITCNSSPMIREKLRESSEYVYDLYYTQTCDAQAMMSCNWANIYTQSYAPELVHDIIDSEEDQCYDDEDDSNDEGNWRNDYPDEVGSNSSLEGSHEDTFLQYRCREAQLDNSDEDGSGYLDGSYWS